MRLVLHPFVGLGLMGHGIAQVCASKGFDVVAVETSSESLNRGMGYISKSLQQVVARDVKKGVDKAAAEEKADATLKKISAVTDIGALNSCDLVIEAAPESLALKESLYKNLPSVMRNDAVIASNTSGMFFLIVWLYFPSCIANILCIFCRFGNRGTCFILWISRPYHRLALL